jgi:deoxyribodipyrimidine photo-lyase
MQTAIVLFRHDLRLADHPALMDACERFECVIPVFIWDTEALGSSTMGAAKRVWLHHSLEKLQCSLKELGSDIVLRQGDTVQELLNIIKSSHVSEVLWSSRYEPVSEQFDDRVQEALNDFGVEVKEFKASLIVEPTGIQKKTGGHYKVFTPYWTQCKQQLDVPPPLGTPSQIPAPKNVPSSLALEALGLLPRIQWYGGIQRCWTFGEAAAHEVLAQFVESKLMGYSENRDALALEGTSSLSPYLASGELSPCQVYHAIQEAVIEHPSCEGEAEAFLRQLFWREFSYHLLYHEPQMVNDPLRPEFQYFPWRNDAEALRKWQRGETGYPIVDAGMRQLWETGTMHNRVRMVVASFLVKDLFIHWREGAQWFWDTLVDADLANNTFSWQWVAGSGADASPYFRVFNPVKQGEKFDPDGVYVRRWIPELSALPNKNIHQPWTTPKSILDVTGFIIGDTYPEPMVNHDLARIEALSAYKYIRGRIQASG